MKRILLTIALVFGLLPLYAADNSGDIRVSVLTCSPGQEVYSLYGHTAIRVQDMVRGTDHVFNYGVFDFNTEHFVWKFVLGETDYICMAVPWEFFVREYEARGSSVVARAEPYRLRGHSREGLSLQEYPEGELRLQIQLPYEQLHDPCDGLCGLLCRGQYRVLVE